MKKHILILGLPGAGKTVFAQRLARVSRVEHIEVDRLFWTAPHSSIPLPDLRAKVTAALRAECWIVEGHFTKIGDLVLAHEPLIFWLDYPVAVSCFRCLKRGRGFSWLWRQRAHSQRAFREATRDYPHVVRFRAPKDAERFFRTLPPY